MALIKCEKCGHEISDKAIKCPKCGNKVVHDTKNSNRLKCLWIFLSVLLLILLMVFCFRRYVNMNIENNRMEAIDSCAVGSIGVEEAIVDSVAEVVVDTVAISSVESTEYEQSAKENLAGTDEAQTNYTDEELFAKAKEYFDSYDDEVRDKAFPLFRIAANRGYAPAQCYLGWCYAIGVGVREDAREATKWYRKSAENGYSGGQMKYAQCLESGDGVAENMEEALYWYGKAAEQGVFAAKAKINMASKRGE